MGEPDKEQRGNILIIWFPQNWGLGGDLWPLRQPLACNLFRLRVSQAVCETLNQPPPRLLLTPMLPLSAALSLSSGYLRFLDWLLALSSGLRHTVRQKMGHHRRARFYLGKSLA